MLVLLSCLGAYGFVEIEDYFDGAYGFVTFYLGAYEFTVYFETYWLLLFYLGAYGFVDYLVTYGFEIFYFAANGL